MLKITLNGKKKLKCESVRTIKSEIDDIQPKSLPNLQKLIQINSGKEFKDIPPVIPIAESGHGLIPPFNIRIQYNNRSTFFKETINLDKIKGTVSNNHLIDSNFHPKREFINKRFRKVWRWIQNNPNNNENIIYPSSIVLAKITDNDYYVVDGLRRVVALKFSNIKTVTALVMDYREVYDKILERRKRIELQKKQAKTDIIHSNSGFKPVKPRIRPTPIIKGQRRK